tara:strand:+ start:310 stop:465 length:156 start_codon:yes stop_codon:yes gene_type:complete
MMTKKLRAQGIEIEVIQTPRNPAEALRIMEAFRRFMAHGDKQKNNPSVKKN